MRIAIFIFILLLVISISLVYSKNFGASANLSAAYLGRCTVCDCLYELAPHQVCIIRQGAQPTCLVCPKCKK